MKFELKHQQAKTMERFEFDGSYVYKDSQIGSCGCCQSTTRWKEWRFPCNICSEECARMLLTSSADTPVGFEFTKRINDECIAAQTVDDRSKDIIVVVHNQLSYIHTCLQSIKEHTKNYKLYIWDNGSDQDTKDFLEFQCLNSEGTIELIRSETNLGFIKPNNDLAAIGDGDYIILLNSDTQVYKHWSDVMLAHLQNNPETAQVGFWGGYLDETGKGFGGDHGSLVDYIPGWCFAISRGTYNRYGLFSKELEFAYCEDADLSLRLKEAGYGLYSLYSPLVQHFGNKTITEVHKKGDIDVAATFERNHRYMRRRWDGYLKNHRVTREGILNERHVTRKVAGD